MTQKNIYTDPDQLLSSFDGITKAEAPPFFYSKLVSRMQQGIPEKPQPYRMALRPVLATIMLTVLLASNIFLLVQRKEARQNNDQPATIESFASAYGLGTSTVY